MRLTTLIGVGLLALGVTSAVADDPRVTFNGTGGVYTNIFSSNSRQACTACHATALSGDAARHYAPALANWDDAATAQTNAANIDTYIAADVMPYTTLGTYPTYPSNPLPLNASEKALVASWAAAGGLPSSTPYGLTQSATSITRVSATLNSTVNANGQSVSAGFVAGFDYEYNAGASISSPSTTSNFHTGTDGGGTANNDASNGISVGSLACGTQYAFRVRGSNSAGAVTAGGATASSNTVTFTTSACPNITNSIANQTVSEDNNSSSLTVTLSLSTDDFNVSSSNALVVPNTSTCVAAGYCKGGSGTNRSIQLRPIANAFGATTITLTATDGVSVDPTPLVFTFTVNSVNDNPTISDITNQIINEDSATSALAFTVADVETAAASLSVSGSSSNTTLVPNSNIIFGGSGSARTVTATPAANQFGLATITVTVTDANLGTDVDTFTLTVNAQNDAPSITDVTNQSINEDGVTASLPFTIDDVETAASSLVVSASSSNTILVPNNNANLTLSGSAASRSIIVTPAANEFGSSTITISVFDGTTTTNDTFLLTVSSQADTPVVTTNAPSTCIEDSPCNFVPSALDGDGDVVFTWALMNAPSGMAINASSGAITWTPTNGQTTSGLVTVTATDAGMLSGNNTFTIAVDGVNDAPLISSSAITSATEDVAYTYAVSVTDPDDSNNGIDLTWSLTSAPAGMSVSSTGVISWTPTEGVLSSGTVTVRVVDGGENSAAPATQSFVITVAAVDDAPIFSSSAVTTASEDVAYLYDANAADAELSTISYALISAPAGMTINSSSGVVNWTPTEGVLSSGTVTIRASESDGLLTTNQSFTITVTPVNDAPLISSSAVLTATEDTLYSYVASVSDPDDLNNGTQLTWSLINAPIGMSVSSTGTVTWTPLNGVTTSGAVTLRVADGGENGAAAATQIFTVAVTGVNDAPQISAISAQTVTELSPLAIIVGVTDPDDLNDGSGALTFGLVGAPSGMIVSNTGVISWTPGEDSEGVYNVSVSVADGGENGAVSATAAFVVTVNKLDVDTDTIADYHDNCPLVSNTNQLNTDGDTEGNVCDLDDDNDQIPDTVEIAMGLDPLDASDAALDLDHDGLSNLAEYQACVANSDPLCATIAVDNVAPDITTNGALVVDSTGYVTRAGEEASAEDVHDGVVPVTADLISPFRPGRHVITWTAEDAANNVATVEQQIDVLPYAQIDGSLVVGENKHVMVPVRLNGEAPTYPVVINFTISGSAGSTDHNAVAGQLSIASGDRGFIEFDTSADSVSESDETVVVTLNSISTNAILSNDKVSTVTIVDRQVPPSVALEVEQNALLTQQIFSNNGVVTLRAVASDPNGGNLSYSWGETSNALGISVTGATATFDPLSLAAGDYHVVVSVSDGLATVKRETTINVMATMPTLSNVEDSDHDGIDDQTDGMSDSDADGVSNYLDPVNASDMMNISNDDEHDRFDRLMQTESGLHLALGNHALAARRVGARLSSLDIKDINGNVIGDSNFQLVGELFDFTISGLSDVHKQAIVVIPLKTAILPESVYRKFIGGSWRSFDANNGDSIATAATNEGKCPALYNTTAWTSGVNATHDCLRLTITDGGSNDGDGLVNGSVADPGGLAVVRNKAEPSAPTESQTGSGQMLWWSIALMLLLGSVRQFNHPTRSVRACK